MTGRYRIVPVAVLIGSLLAGCGRSSDAAPVAAPPPEADVGERTWKRVCAECHDGGLGDGPAIGDADAWRPRLAQGKTVLLQHAINGFTGAIGDMPPRGGDESLSDSQVEAALSYMIGKSASPPE